MELLTKEQMLGVLDLPVEELAVPEWNGKVLVRGLSGTERDEYEQSIMEARKGLGGKVEIKPNFANAKAKMAVKCIVDKDGKRVFSDADVPALGRKSAAALNRIVDKIQALSGMTTKDVKDLEGNSETAQGDGSPSV